MADPCGSPPPSQDRRGTGAGFSAIPVAPLFADNPFRLLGLPANASSAEIRARVEEARIEAELDGAEGLIDRVTRAQTELLDPARRLRHEILWFYDPPLFVYNETIDPARLPEIVENLRPPVGMGPLDAWRRRHDLALWLLFIAVHSVEAAVTEHFVVRALAAWRDLSADTAYLRDLRNRGYPRSQLAAFVWHTALDALSATARHCVTIGDIDRAAAVARAGVSTGLEPDDLRRLTDPAVDTALLDAQRALSDARDTPLWERQVAHLVPKEHWERTLDSVQTWASSVVRSVTPVRRLVHVLGNVPGRNVPHILDKTALLLRERALELVTSLESSRVRVVLANNIPFDAQYAAVIMSTYWVAHDLLGISKEFAATSKAVNIITADGESISNRIRFVQILIQSRMYTEIAQELQRFNSSVNAFDGTTSVSSIMRLSELLYSFRVLVKSKAVSVELWDNSIAMLMSAAIKLYERFGDTERALMIIDRCFLLNPSDQMTNRLYSERDALLGRTRRENQQDDVEKESTSRGNETSLGPRRSLRTRRSADKESTSRGNETSLGPRRSLRTRRSADKESTSRGNGANRDEMLFHWYMSDARKLLESGQQNAAETAALIALSLAREGSQRAAVVQFLAQFQQTHGDHRRKGLKSASRLLILLVIVSIVSIRFII